MDSVTNLFDDFYKATISNRDKFDWKQLAFEKQQGFIQDPGRLKALFCTRRAAKSYTGGIYLIKEALENPGCNCLFIGLTRLSAHGIVWKDILKEIDLKYKLGIKFNETLLTATLPNGSVIYVAGADSDESEMNKLLGKKYRLVILDEASMFSVNMHQLVYGVLKPATADNRGSICLLGTSSNITRGLFYDITTNKEPGWSIHIWTAYDNPHVVEQWKEELDDIDKNRPLFKETALFKQWYLNQWVVDEEARVYKFNEKTNSTNSIARNVDHPRYLLGVDLAHSPDSTAFVIGAYNNDAPPLYITYARKHLKMDITDCAQEVKRLEGLYNFDVKVVDGANKMAVAELNNRHGLNLLSADKTGKIDFIRLMNDDFIQQKIKLLSNETKDLQEEYNTLVWVTDNGKVVEPRKEHPTIHNDCADAALYMWRYAFTYLFKPQALPYIKPGSVESWEPKHVERLSEMIRKEQNPSEFDLNFDKDLWNLDIDESI